jgi:thiol:disulfide interchange protein DsbC
MKGVGMRLGRIVWVVGLLAVVGLLPLGLQAEPSGAEVPTLSRQEAQHLLGERADRVLRIEASEIPSFWAVEIEKNRRRQLVYIDFRKTLLLQGDVIRLPDGENLTRVRHEAMNRVDVSRIPLQEALLVGTGRAPNRVIVFTDPKCSYCKKLHEELKKVVKLDPDIAFFIKMMPLDLHPDAYMISKSIVCNRSLALLEDSFADRFVPPPLCQGQEVDQTLALARQLGIRSTPTLLLPDGRIVSGYRDAAALLRLLGSKVQSSGSEGRPGR